MSAAPRQAELYAAGGQAPQRLEAPDADLLYWPAMYAGDEADRLLGALLEECQWRQHEVRIAGRLLACPRLSAWHGEPGAVYGYSGSRHEPAPWGRALSAVLERVQGATGVRFDSVLANLYRDGADGMGWHSDDEPELGPRPAIAALSLGAERRFVLRHRRRRDLPTVELRPAHGSLLLMAGDTQRCWRHALPKTRRPVGRRLSLTFRRVSAPR